MLVALIPDSWSQEKKNVIENKKVALADAQNQELREWSDIENLSAGEELWLYSHGSDTTFASVDESELAGFLVLTAKMPAGARRVTLKGCRTEKYAKRLQEILNHQNGYEGVVVWGFEGEASQTTADGDMLVRRGGESEKRKAKIKGALAHLSARRANQSQTEAERRRVAAERSARTYTAVPDDGLTTYVGNDDRMRRRSRRDDVRAMQTEDTAASDSESDENSKMEL